MERYVITWRPIETRVIVALSAFGLTILACAGGAGHLGLLCIGTAFGCMVPSIRDIRRDTTRKGSPPSLAWFATCACAAVVVVLAREVGMRGAQDVDMLLAFLIVMFLTVMLLPVEPPVARDVPRREDGVALQCTKCGYDMEGVPGAVCPECGEDCGLERGDAA